MQYRGRVKGREASNACVVALPYYEQKLVVREEIARRLDVAVVGIGGRIDGSYQHDFLGDYLRDEALGRELEAGPIAIGQEGLRRVPMAMGVAGGPGKVSGILGDVRPRLVGALVADEETAASCLRLSEAA